MTNDAAVAECPKCGAPCDTFVHMRGGDYGWSTTDLERTDYKYSATTVAELRAEVERLQALSAAISRDCNECANQRNEANARAAAAERRVAELRDVVASYKAAHEAVQNNPAMLLSCPNAGLKCAESMQSLELARMSLFAALTKESPLRQEKPE